MVFYDNIMIVFDDLVFTKCLENNGLCCTVGTLLTVSIPLSGISRGTILSPFLFSLLVKNISSALLYAKLLIFVNDTKNCMRISSVTDCELLQENLDRLVLWWETVNLKFNIAKCQVMTYTRYSNYSD